MGERDTSQSEGRRLPPDEVPETLLTPRVSSAVADVVERLDRDEIPRDKSRVDARLSRLFALSPYIMTTCLRQPDDLGWLLESGALENSAPADGSEALGALIDELDVEPANGTALEARQLARLRCFRHRHLVRILWRDLDSRAGLDETLQDLTNLAEACIVVATRWAEAAECDRSGVPRDQDGRAQSMIVLGMGKLGGGELNVSSDVDLIYLWGAPGKTDGRRELDNSEHFTRVARRLNRLLGAVTADGFAYRVDTRLRPFGESGPQAMHLEAFEHYLLTQGRDWERYAMIKARALTGQRDDIAHLDSLRQPFVYRRYIDYDALVSLATLKTKIHQSLANRPVQGDNVKLGRGGIREVEFTGQAFQLMRGGRESRLQIRPIRQVLKVLAELGYLPAGEADELIASYSYLRRVENALQAMRDEQTHVLPTDKDDLLRLTLMLGETDEAAFRQNLANAREHVAKSFDAVLGDAGSSDLAAVEAGPGGATEESAIIGECPGDEEGVVRWLEAIGIEGSRELVERLMALSGGPFHRRLTARAQQRLEAVLPGLAGAARATAEPVIALERALDFTRAVAGRSGYLQALNDRPAALDRLVRVFAQSAWVAELATRSPIVVDELIGQTSATLFEDATTILAEALAEADRLAERDLEQQMDALRQFRQVRELRIALAALDEELPPMQVSDRLSWLAEAIIAAVLLLVRGPLEARYGGELPTLIVVAYGKLGGLELGFGSDLDLVFLRDVADRKAPDSKASDDAEIASRMVRRFVHFMGTVTPAGRLYEVDLRLRPNGNSGVLVGTLDSFSDYQRADAWTWEHQALLRARAVAGVADARARFDTLRQSILCTPRDEAELRADVASMRERMRETLGSGANPTLTDDMDLKQDAGGVADIEFIVQYLALAHAANAPSLVRFTDNVRVLTAAGRLRLVAATDAAILCSDYVSLRERLHQRALALENGPVAVDETLTQLRTRVIEIRERIL